MPVPWIFAVALEAIIFASPRVGMGDGGTGRHVQNFTDAFTPGFSHTRSLAYARARLELPQLRTPLITSWYTERHRQYGFLDHPCLCGLLAQDSVRFLLETVGTGGGENLAVGLPWPREELASASSSTISHHRARKLGKTQNRVGLSTCHTHTQKKKKQKDNTAETTGLLRVSS